MQNKFVNCWHTIWQKGKAKYFFTTGLLGLLTSTVFADDLLQGVLTDIQANFGLKSVFIKGLYLMEIYYGWHRWKETHNPWSAAGIVVVAMYLTYAIGKWVGG